MELTLVPLLLPEIQQQFGLSIRELAWVFNSYGFAVAAGVLLGGWLGDAFSNKRVFSIGVILFATGSAVVANSASYEIMIAGRTMQGFGGGIFSPLVPVLLTKASPNRPGKVLIIWGSVTGYVAAFAPVIYGSSLLGPHGWHPAFLIFAAVSIVALVIVHGADIPDDTVPSRQIGASLRNMFQSISLWVMFGYVFCTYGSITLYLFRLPLWLKEQDFQVVSIGVALSMIWLSFSILSTLLRNSVDKPRVRSILLAGPVFIACGFIITYLCLGATCLVISSILIGSGLACSNAPSTQLILRFAPKGMSAVSASLDITFARLGGVTTVAILAHAVFSQAVMSVLFMSLAATMCAMIVGRELQEQSLSSS